MNVEYFDRKGRKEELEFSYTLSNPDSSSIELTMDGNGVFYAYGEQSQFASPWTYEITPNPDYDTKVGAYLVRDKQSGNYVIFVDEKLEDGEDTWYDFRDGDYDYIERVYWFTLPAGVSGLDNITVTAMRFIVPE